LPFAAANRSHLFFSSFARLFASLFLPQPLALLVYITHRPPQHTHTPRLLFSRLLLRRPMAPNKAPRSILKCSPVIPQTPHPPHGSVRFPSSPKLSTVHLTHCPTSYDRTPIVVLPNSCALPERNCRSYSPNGTPNPANPTQSSNWGKELHPSVFNRTSPNHVQFGNGTYEGSLLPPPLTSDDGSSEESDGLASPPPEFVSNPPSRQNVPSQAHLHSAPLSHPPISPYGSSSGPDTYATSSSSYDHSSGTPSEYSLSFLPYAPSAYCQSNKRDKQHKHQQGQHRVVHPTSFTSSWSQSEESSCLGGF